MTISNKILVTGGTGFVGRWMRETEPKGYKTVYLSQSVYNAIPFECWQGYSVVHLAPVDPARAIRAAKDTRLLYCSSGIVYHPENDTKYRQNKIRWEADCLASGVDCVIARLFAFYGAGLDSNKALRQFEIAVENHEPLEVWGDGSCVRSYMSGCELGEWMWAILLKGKNGEAYDVGSDTPITLLQLAQSMSDNIVMLPDKFVPMPYYLPPNTKKTKGLL